MTIDSGIKRPRCVDFTSSAWAPAPSERRPSRRPEQRGRRSPPAAPPAGAVRLTDIEVAAPRVRHVRKLSAGLVFVAAGILVTTTSTGTVEQAPPVPVDAPPLAATFFFDDAQDALAERAARSAAGALARPAALAAQAAPTAPAAAPALASMAGARGGARNGTSGAADPDLSAAIAALPGSTGANAADTDVIEARVPNALAALRERAEAPPDASVTTVSVGAGDTLSGILNENGVRIEQMPALLGDDVVGRHLSRLRIGQQFDITRLADGSFHSLAARIGPDRHITIGRRGDGFAVAAIDLPVEKERVVTSGTIEQSLYVAAEQANLKRSTIMTLADIFQWELDFSRDIRQGDQFAVVYDRLYREGRYIGDGDILAAEFERGGRTYRAVRFTRDDGTTGYYSPDGTSKRRTFLRHPVDIVRVTSHFDPNRLHPVLGHVRAHRGVDYGAPHGSPIRATADGVVKFSGTKSAYGKTVILQHGKKFSTLYAHMSRISDKSTVGRRVRQGDVIGYVGKTGRVTGTHLHYEFRVDNAHVDPLTVELPAAAPLPEGEREALRTVAEELIAQMRSVLPSGDEATELAAAAPLDGSIEPSGL